MTKGRRAPPPRRMPPAEGQTSRVSGSHAESAEEPIAEESRQEISTSGEEPVQEENGDRSVGQEERA